MLHTSHLNAVQIHTQAENSRVSFDLPAEHSALANARLLLVVMPEPKTSAEAATIQREAERLAKHAKLIAAFDELKQVSAFREIGDPMQWQRELRRFCPRSLNGYPRFTWQLLRSCMLLYDDF